MTIPSIESSAEDAVAISDLRVVRATAQGPATILTGIDLRVGQGESVAIVGESGSGKSITARAVMGLLPPTLSDSGEIVLDGREVLGQSEKRWRAMRGRDVGLIMQDPFTTLNPLMRCGDIVGESLAGAGGSRRARRAEAVRRLAEVGIEDPAVADRYPFQLSGGMRQRVGIAAALARDPKVLIADEPTTALDVTTQRGILALIKRVQRARGMALILITHDLRVAFAMCDRAYVLYAGTVLETAPADALDAEPLHPYSHALLLSEPSIEERMKELVSIPGTVPVPDDVPGCPFSPRCAWAEDACRTTKPTLREVEPGHWTACLRIDDIRDEMRVERQTLTDHAPATPVPPVAAPAVVTMTAVSKTFPGDRGAVHALDDVSIVVREGEGVGIVGESGSGKTTLARMLVGLETATSGRVEIDGVDATAYSRVGAADRRRLRKTVQMVFQDPYSSLNPSHSIGATLAEAVRTHFPGAKDVKGEVAGLLESVGLPAAFAPRRPASLSGGMRQRVAIARALAAKPKLLICDESVSALDVSVQAQILNLLIRLREDEGVGYLFITHDLSVVRQIADRLYVMYRGEVVEEGATDDVLLAPKHEYTQRLLSAAPRASSKWISGSDMSPPVREAD